MDSSKVPFNVVAYSDLEELEHLRKLLIMAEEIPDFISVEESKERARKLFPKESCIDSNQRFKNLGKHNRGTFVSTLRKNKIPVYMTKTNRLLWGPYAFERIVLERLQLQMSRRQARHVISSNRNNYEGIVEAYRLY